MTVCPKHRTQMSQRRDQRLQGRLGTFSSKALWCSNSDLRAFSTSTSLETPEGDWAWRFTTVILRDRSWRDTRHSRCSRSSWQGAGRREECCGSVCRATGVPMGLLGGPGAPSVPLFKCSNTSVLVSPKPAALASLLRPRLHVKDGGVRLLPQHTG